MSAVVEVYVGDDGIARTPRPTTAGGWVAAFGWAIRYTVTSAALPYPGRRRRYGRLSILLGVLAGLIVVAAGSGVWLLLAWAL